MLCNKHPRLIDLFVYAFRIMLWKCHEGTRFDFFSPISLSMCRCQSSCVARINSWCAGGSLGRGAACCDSIIFHVKGLEPLPSEFTCATSTKPFCRAIDRKQQSLGVLGRYTFGTAALKRWFGQRHTASHHYTALMLHAKWH